MASAQILKLKYMIEKNNDDDDMFDRATGVTGIFLSFYFSLSVRADAIKGMWLLGISSACNRDD